MLGSMAHVHPFQCAVDVVATLGSGHSPIGEPQLCFLANSQIGDQVEWVEYEANLPVPDLGALARIQRSLGPAL